MNGVLGIPIRHKKIHWKKIKLRDLQSLIGLLNFACYVVVPRRAFLRRLIMTADNRCMHLNTGIITLPMNFKKCK